MVKGEHFSIWILWIFFLITSALVTVCSRIFFIQCRSHSLLQEQFSNLKWCRSHNKVCRILETIKAFGWICWGILSILLVVTLIKLVLSDSGSRNRGTYPQTSQATQTRQAANTSATVTDPSRTTTTTQPQAHTVQSVPAAHGAKTQNATHQPATTNTATYYNREDQTPAAALVWSVRPPLMYGSRLPSFDVILWDPSNTVACRFILFYFLFMWSFVLKTSSEHNCADRDA